MRHLTAVPDLPADDAPGITSVGQQVATLPPCRICDRTADETVVMRAHGNAKAPLKRVHACNEHTTTVTAAARLSDHIVIGITDADIVYKEVAP